MIPIWQPGATYVCIGDGYRPFISQIGDFSQVIGYTIHKDTRFYYLNRDSGSIHTDQLWIKIISCSDKNHRYLQELPRIVILSSVGRRRAIDPWWPSQCAVSWEPAQCRRKNGRLSMATSVKIHECCLTSIRPLHWLLQNRSAALVRLRLVQRV